ncbi:hypothetical protein [Streptomyces sp. SP18CS02]|uniref:hypothetical protein n=1 Tax=Streptomyces sp. SP18CS02 TaxID=3002531 RepID=UPI002E7A7532|nr:hypothetical protein [Streptomyces sp. SP18CS02]MEE1751963.1 hypothetical protein [Streptomyces sp. SP18CS02]
MNSGAQPATPPHRRGRLPADLRTSFRESARTSSGEHRRQAELRGPQGGTAVPGR